MTAIAIQGYLKKSYSISWKRPPEILTPILGFFISITKKKRRRKKKKLYPPLNFQPIIGIKQESIPNEESSITAWSEVCRLMGHMHDYSSKVKTVRPSDRLDINPITNGGCKDLSMGFF